MVFYALPFQGSPGSFNKRGADGFRCVARSHVKPVANNGRTSFKRFSETFCRQTTHDNSDVVFKWLAFSPLRRTHHQYVSDLVGETDCDGKAVTEVAGVVVDFGKAHDALRTFSIIGVGPVERSTVIKSGFGVSGPI
jgi:hypothetical protein